MSDYAKKGSTHTSTNLDDYALVSQIPSLSGYATQSWVNGKGYLTSSSLSGYATTDWVGKQGYLTSASLNGYATQAWVGQQGFATTSSVDTKLSSYVTKTALSDYYTKTESDGRYQPKGSYAAASHNHDAAYAAKSHAHAIADVTGLQTALDGKAPAGHTHSQYVTSQTAADTYATKSSLSAYVTTTALGTTLGSYAKKADIPSLDGYLKTADADKKYQAAGSYAAASHAHTIANVIGLQDALNGKAASNHSHDDLYYTESEVDSKLSAYVTTTALGTTLSSYLTNKTAADTYATKQTVSSLATTVNGKADAATTTAELAKKLDASAVSKYDANQKIDDALARAQGAAEKTAADALDGAKTEINAAIADTKAELRGDIDDLAKEIAGGFGTIRYEGLDGGSDAGVYPTSYKAGGTPSLHAPSREGWDFAGWEWRRGDASGDGGNLADAFAAAGEVVLTATWAQEAPKGTYFFTEEDPLMKGAPAPQEHVIKVVMTRTRSYPVDRVEFSWDNWTGLIAEGSSITLTVGTDYNEATGEIRNGRSCALARDAAGANKASIEGLNMVPVQFASRQCGLYVGVSVPDGAVDKVVESYTEGSYVDSLVKMSYALAG